MHITSASHGELIQELKNFSHVSIGLIDSYGLAIKVI